MSCCPSCCPSCFWVLIPLKHAAVLWLFLDNSLHLAACKHTSTNSTHPSKHLSVYVYFDVG